MHAKDKQILTKGSSETTKKLSTRVIKRLIDVEITAALVKLPVIIHKTLISGKNALTIRHMLFKYDVTKFAILTVMLNTVRAMHRVLHRDKILFKVSCFIMLPNELKTEAIIKRKSREAKHFTIVSKSPNRYGNISTETLLMVTY